MGGKPKNGDDISLDNHSRKVVKPKSMSKLWEEVDFSLLMGETQH